MRAASASVIQCVMCDAWYPSYGQAMLGVVDFNYAAVQKY